MIVVALIELEPAFFMHMRQNPFVSPDDLDLHSPREQSALFITTTSSSHLLQPRSEFNQIASFQLLNNRLILLKPLTVHFDNNVRLSISFIHHLYQYLRLYFCIIAAVHTDDMTLPSDNFRVVMRFEDALRIEGITAVDLELGICQRLVCRL